MKKQLKKTFINSYTYIKNTIPGVMKKILFFFGLCFLLLILFSFTSGPFWIYYWFGTHNTKLPGQPTCIVLLGGGGMPSESGLIRCYHAANLANKFPNARIIIALPADTITEESSIQKMKHELIIRDIDSMRITYETQGKNTRAQALHVLSICTSPEKDTLVLVTSPAHMLRSMKTFKKAGFINIGGFSAFEYAIETDIVYDDSKLGGNKRYIPKIGKNINLRYRFWTHLKYEIVVLRECFALAYYQIRGWI